MMTNESELVKKLIAIQYADQNATSGGNSAESIGRWYKKRNLFLYEAIALALRCNLAAGIRLDPLEPAWPVAFIELPSGQISYHLEQHSIEWDKHTTEQKRLRILEYIVEKIGM